MASNDGGGGLFPVAASSTTSTGPNDAPSDWLTAGKSYRPALVLPPAPPSPPPSSTAATAAARNLSSPSSSSASEPATKRPRVRPRVSSGDRGAPPVPPVPRDRAGISSYDNNEPWGSSSSSSASLSAGEPTADDGGSGSTGHLYDVHDGSVGNRGGDRGLDRDSASDGSRGGGRGRGLHHRSRRRPAQRDAARPAASRYFDADASHRMLGEDGGRLESAAIRAKRKATSASASSSSSSAPASTPASSFIPLPPPITASLSSSAASSTESGVMAARAALMAEEGEGEGWAAFRQRTKEMREATGGTGGAGGAAGGPGRADPATWLRLAALQEDSICLLLRQQIENEKANAAAAAAGSRAAAEADETTGSGLGAAGAGAGIAVWGGDKSSGGGGKRARRRRQGAAGAHDAKATVLIANATRAVRLSVRQKQLAIYREGLNSCPRQQRREQGHTHSHTSASSPSSGSQGTRGGRRELHRGMLRVLRCMLESGDSTEQEVQAAWDDALNECASGTSGISQRVDEGRVPPGGPPAFASDKDGDVFDPSLWCEYLSCRQSMFASFSVPAMRQEFVRAIQSLRRARHLRYRRQGQESEYEADCGMLGVFCLAAEFERSSGYVINMCRRIVSVCMRADKRSGVHVRRDNWRWMNVACVYVLRLLLCRCRVCFCADVWHMVSSHVCSFV